MPMEDAGADLHETLMRVISDTWAGLIEDGLSVDPTLVEDLTREALQQTLVSSAGPVVDRLYETARDMLQHRLRGDILFRRALRNRWGSALDGFTMFWVSAYEIGEGFQAKHQPPDGEPYPDTLIDALLGLHARACRVALEVHTLLSNGLGAGALGRARTLHEIAVTAGVLCRFGREDGHQDLAQRYLEHNVVSAYKDATRYQQDCESLRYEPFTDEEMAELRLARDATVATYGAEFGKDNGWAAGLKGPKSPRFVDLEELAGLGHLRSHYSWASAEVHSTPKSWHLNIREWGGHRWRDASRALDDLADPAQMALISLNQVTANILGADPEPRLDDILAGAALNELLTRVIDAFMEAHEGVELERGAAIEDLKPTNEGSS